jgi:hypothetical protein
MKVYQNIAVALSRVPGQLNVDYDAIAKMINEHLPTGAGFDGDWAFDIEKSIPKKRIVLYFHYHHMNERGFYTHWTCHKVTIKPCLAFEFDLWITKEQVTDDTHNYFYELIDYALREEI